MNMWSSLLLLCSVQLLAITADELELPYEWKQCLTNCYCGEMSLYRFMTIACMGNQDIDPGELSDQIDSMLSSNQMYGRLWWLIIVNSSLTHVPRSICRLTTLRLLNLQNNQLTQLPDNCLTKLRNLIHFNASDNEIETLQDGVFDGLTQLEYIDLSRNRISSVGSNVFAATSKLFNLVGIFLNDNNFTFLGPYISTPGLIANDKMHNTNDLRHNSIPTYKNETVTAFSKVMFPFTSEYKETSFLSTQLLFTFVQSSRNKLKSAEKAIAIMTNDLRHNNIKGNMTNDFLRHTKTVKFFSISISDEYRNIARQNKRIFFLSGPLLPSTRLFTTNDKNDKKPITIDLRHNNISKYANETGHPVFGLHGICSIYTPVTHIVLSCKKILTNCSSILNFTRNFNDFGLVVYCQRRRHLDGRQLLDQLDSMLSSNRMYMYSVLSSLRMFVFKDMLNENTTTIRLSINYSRYTYSLDVNCQELSDIDNEQLSDELDSMLSSNMIHGRLWWLTIANSSLTHVPRSICRLTTLFWLRLDNNQLTRLPDNCLSNLSNLISFIAFNNKIEKLQDGLFYGLRNLMYIFLSKNRINSIGSTTFAMLTNLSHLHLDNNRLTRLPDNCFADLSNLELLRVDNNAIETLQDGIFDELINLQQLHLGSNRIMAISSSVFSKLSKLQKLNLNDNLLSRLPHNCLTNLSNLVLFTASNNAIEILQDGLFDGLTQLRYLDLSGNKIKSVFLSVFAQLPYLQELYLNDNLLTRLTHEWFTNLPSLRSLWVYNNKIETLPDGIFDRVTSLWYLDLSRNRIRSIGLSVFGKLPYLVFLYLDHNLLTRLPDTLNSLHNLRFFSASNNKIEQLQDGLFDGLIGLTSLDLSNNRLTRLPDNSISKLHRLCTFEASNNAIEILQDGVFDGLTDLSYLDLRGNRISSIGLFVFATSSNLPSLTTILLSDNNLTSLEPWIYDRGIIGSNPIFCKPWFNDSLNVQVSIDLSYNKISKFTNTMGRHILDQQGRCTMLNVYVNLAYNKIQHIEDILNGWHLNANVWRRCGEILNGKMQKNFTINTLHNNILCDCTSYNYYRILAVQNEPFIPYYSEPFKIQYYCNLSDPLTRTSSILNASEYDPMLFTCELFDRCPSGCVCVHRPANRSLHVYCSNKNLTVLPHELPELPDSRTKYKLDFSNNKLLRRLEYRDYFVDTSILDVSNCSVEDVLDWTEIVKMPDINLSRNKITSPPASFLSLHITTKKLNLANNPWDCSCDNKWMSHCFSSIADRLTQKVLCYSPSRLRGKNIIQITDEEFCVDPASKAASEAASEATKRALITSLSSVAGVVVVLLSVGVILYRLRVKLYTRWKFHPFDRDECAGEDMDYDVFLLCSSNDEIPDGDEIREQLAQRGYRVCYPRRDFRGGAPITENICNAVERSKRTVCFLTANFCQSSYCMYEFEVAHHHNIVRKQKKRLIVLMALDNPNDLYANDASDTATLRQYLRRYTYIDYRADDWLDNLLYALPLHGMDEAEQADQEPTDFNDDDAILLQ